MGKPLSIDLRERALAAVDAGMSRRAAARRFGVSASSVIRWDASRCETGGFEAKPQGGDMRSRRIGERRAEVAAVMAAFEEERDQTLAELRARLTERGVVASTSSLSRFFRRHGVTRKKDRSYGRAGSRGHPEEAPRLVRGATGPRPRKAPLHRRDLDGDEHGAHAWPLPEGRPVANGLSTWPSEDHDARRRSPPRRPGRAIRHRPRTVYRWLPRGKGFGDLWQRVGCGHAFGVRDAVIARAP